MLCWANRLRAKAGNEIAFTELPTPGTKITAAQIMGSLEPVKSVSDIFSPISGKILQVNANVKQTPSIINKSPYQDGRFVRVKASNLRNERRSLLSAEAYCNQFRELWSRWRTSRR